MADRTLRRAYGGTRESTGELSGIIDGDVGSKPDSAGTIVADDSATVIDGTDAIGDTERVSSGIGAVEIDPEQLDDYIDRDSRGNGTGDSTGKQRRKRGPNKRTIGAKKAEASIEPFVKMIHAFMAAKIPEMTLAEGEAKRVSDAYIDFCIHHEIPILSAKRMSEINLISALWMVYGTRIVAIRNRMKEEVRVKKARNVTPIQAVQ